MHPLVRFALRASVGIAAFGLFMYGVPGLDSVAAIPQKVGAVGEAIGGQVDDVVDTLRTPGNGAAERAGEMLAEQQEQLCEVQVAIGEECATCTDD